MGFKYHLKLVSHTNVGHKSLDLSFLKQLISFKATMFLEQWKRLQMRLSYFWDLTGLEEEEVSLLFLG